MHDAEVGDERVVHVLEEERRGAKGIEGDAVRPVSSSRGPGQSCHVAEWCGKKSGGEWGQMVQLQKVQLRFLWYYLVDMGRQQGVGLCDFRANGALDGGFDFGFGAGGDTGESRISFPCTEINDGVSEGCY